MKQSFSQQKMKKFNKFQKNFFKNFRKNFSMFSDFKKSGVISAKKHIVQVDENIPIYSGYLARWALHIYYYIYLLYMYFFVT